MRRHIYLICILFLLTACQKKNLSNEVNVEFSNAVSEINYSTFVKSAEYLSLHLPDSVLINTVEALYFDDGKIFVKDSKREGIFIFDEKSGQFIHRLKAYGEGPREIKRIGSFCLDSYHKHICIFDSGDNKIKRYDYSGNYVSSCAVDYFVLDMVQLQNDGMICFYPVYAYQEQPSGIWSVDSLNNFRKQLYAHVTEDCKFHYFPMMYNWNDTCAYYYDRNWNELLQVSADTVRLLYTFNIENALPLSKKGIRNLSPSDLDGYNIVHHFAYSEHFILLSVHTFNKNDMLSKNITWILFDQKTATTVVSESLRNDLVSNHDIGNNTLFYKNNSTWVRIDDSSDSIIRLKLLHLL
mgnify:CR=1 FL=1